ncbi:lysine--tRNA ligase [Halobacteriales archaeon QS_8_69_26]|nr:MAG: lysine--tRNA ligase [Halobacteriales archaeon QS_8_69_26]
MSGTDDHPEPPAETRPDDEDDGGDDHHAFWADEVADRIEARDPEEPVVIKGGVSPSGVPHVGHVNEIMRGYYVAAVLRERGYEVRQVFTSDDRDPLRSIPHRLMDLDWTLVERGGFDVGVLGKNLGRPLTDVPDPFGCCDSFGEHQTRLLERSAALLGVPVEFVSTTDLLAEGAFEDVTRELLEKRDLVRSVLTEYQDKVDESYVPFRPVCENCGIVTEGVTAVDPAGGTVDYVCSDVEAGGRTIEGCGHEGTATLREGKLPWRVEWPAQWSVLGVDFEPFGKDHAEGSWPSGVDVAETVLEIDPPEPMVYEWFTFEGEPLSSSSGNVITVAEVLEFVEREAFRYFFVKDPKKARDFSVERIDGLVDEFDRFERAFFDERDPDDRERDLARRAYPYVVDPKGLPEGAVAAADGDERTTVERAAAGELLRGEAEYGDYRHFLRTRYEDRIRIPYRFAAVLGMTDDPVLREDIARREGHLPGDAPGWAVEAGLARVELARNWARHTENEYDYELKRAEMPEVELTDAERAALDDLADFVAGGHDGEAIQGEMYEAARRHDLDVGDFFAAGYRLFFDDDEGPRLGEFLGELDREFVVRRLRREG